MKATSIRKFLIFSAMAGCVMIPGQMGTVEASDMVFPNTGEYLFVRSAPEVSSDWVGKLHKDQVATVVDTQGSWSHIQSGDVDGYVPTEFLFTGSEADAYAETVVQRQATILADVLNVRDGQGTQASILTQILWGEQYEITGDPVNGWYPLQVGEIAGWVCGDYIEEETIYAYAEPKQTPEATTEQAVSEQQSQETEAVAEETVSAEVVPVTADTSQASAGQAVIDYASQFLGNPYVWGGTSLTEGCDCSGYVQSVYANFGVALPRTTWDMENVGYEVSYEEAQPGDLFLYEGHIGLYMGDGTIINAIDEANGIGITNANYTTIKTIRRVL